MKPTAGLITHVTQDNDVNVYDQNRQKTTSDQYEVRNAEMTDFKLIFKLFEHSNSRMPSLKTQGHAARLVKRSEVHPHGHVGGQPENCGVLQRLGFNVIENYTTPDTVELPVHNRKLAVTLSEYKMTK